ncbi:MAG: ATP-binding cassette domain-containing protein, partial [Bacteroidetes bacterium]
MNVIVNIEQLSHEYPPTRKHKKSRVALQQVSLQITRGEIFCLLGPNGSGKSTLFKILSTLIQPQDGTVSILGFDVASQADDVRKIIGVVFQSPSLDKKLTARENLLHQGHLYGLRGETLTQKINQMLARL